MNTLSTTVARDLLAAGKRMMRAAYLMADAETFGWATRFTEATAEARTAQTQAGHALAALDTCPDCGNLGYVTRYLDAMTEPEYLPCPSGCPDTRIPLFSRPADATKTQEVR